MTTEQIQLNNLKENAKEKIDSLKNDVYELCNVLKYQDASNVSHLIDRLDLFLIQLESIELKNK